MTSTYDRVVAVVSKPPDDRTESEADVLMPWFRKKSDLFANLKPGMYNVNIKIIHNSESLILNLIRKRGKET